MKTLMFVDDDHDFLVAQKIFFTARGFRVITAESVDDALQMLEGETPDMFFLDLMMEHYDSGFTLGYRIRKNERFADTPMVMLSGVASATGKRFDGAMEEMHQWSGVDLFVDKPVEQEQLLRLVQEHLDGTELQNTGH